MFSFAYPDAFYLLLLLPVIVLLYYLARKARKRNMSRFGRDEVVGDLIPNVSRYKSRVKLTLELLALAIVVVMLARPRAGAGKTTENLTGIEVMVAVDVSNSMLASSSSDPQGMSRMQRSKMILEKLIEKLSGDKVGLIVFAGNAYMQMPLTGDSQSAKMFLNNINPNMAPTQGTAIGAAIEMATSAFSKQSKAQKAIIVLTDGENHEDDATEAASAARKRGIQVNVVGIGSPQGSPIPLGNGDYLKDDAGQVVNTALNEKMAQEIAEAGKGVYVNGNDSDALDVLTGTLSKLSKSSLATVSYTKHNEQFPLFAGLALLILLLDIFVLDRKNPFLTKFNFFSKEPQKAKA